MNFNLYSSFLFLIGIEMLCLFVYSLIQNKNRLSTIFSLLCFVMALYCIFYAFELMSVTVNQVMFFLKMEYFGAAFISPLWFLMAYGFNSKKSLNLKNIALVFLIPLITLILVNTNEFHHLFYKNITLITYKDLYLANSEKGVLYYIHILYSLVMILGGTILFYNSFKKMKSNRKKQARLMLVGSAIGISIFVLYVLRMTPGVFDPLPFANAIVSGFYYVAVFKYEFLEMKEIIRENSFEQINEGIIVTDIKERLIDFNRAASNVFAWLTTDNIGVNITELSMGIINNNEEIFEIEYNEKNYEFRTNTIQEKNNVSGRIYIFNDATEKKLMLKKLEYNSKFDFLSDTYNRYQLFEFLEIEYYKSCRYRLTFSLLMIDIDLFKVVNDTYGHVAGDEVIKSVAKVCKERIRPSDIIGRYGGEEFLIIMPETKPQNAVVVAESIRNIVENLEIRYGDNTIKTTISIGVAGCNGNDSQKINEIIGNADSALYNAKNNGRNKVELFV